MENRHRVHDPKTMEELFDGDVATAFDGAAADAEEAELRVRNRRGTVLLLVVVIILAISYQTGWLETARRYIVAGSVPKSDTPAVTTVPVDLAGSANWPRTASERLVDTGSPNRSTAVIGLDDLAGANRKEFPGEIAWIRTGRGDAAELHGRLAVTGSPITMEILLEPDAGSNDGYTRMALIVIEGTAVPILEVGQLQRVDPSTGQVRDVEGIFTRIGLDRVLYGYRPGNEDADPRFERRPLFLVAFTLESGQRLQAMFRLPPPE